MSFIIGTEKEPWRWARWGDRDSLKGSHIISQSLSGRPRIFIFILGKLSLSSVYFYTAAIGWKKGREPNYISMICLFFSGLEGFWLLLFFWWCVHDRQGAQNTNDFDSPGTSRWWCTATRCFFVKQAKQKTTFFLFFLYHCVHTTQDGCHCRCALSKRKTHKQEALLVPKGKNHAPEAQTVFFFFF